MSRDVLRGWRFFECDDCGAHWKETCRDHATPSSSQCINKDCESVLYGGISPYFSITDLTIASDGHGNLHKNSYASVRLEPRPTGVLVPVEYWGRKDIPDEPA